MGGGGGGSSSSSSTSSSTTNTDKRQVVDNQSVGVSSDSSTVNVTMTDQGAIDKTFALLQAGGQGVYSSLDKVIGLADTLLKGSLSVVKDSTGVVSQAYETAENTKTGSIDQKTMIVLAVAGAAAFVFRKK